MFRINESSMYNAASTCRYVFQWTHLQRNATNNLKQGFYNGWEEAKWFWND